MSKLLTVGQGLGSGTGRDDILAAAKIGLNDMQYLDLVRSLFTPKGSVHVRNHHDEWRDITPDNGSSVKFGDKVTFRYGQSGLASLARTEIVFEIEQDPAVFINGAEDTNGEERARSEWVPWLGERLIGDEVRITYNSNVIRSYSNTFQHYLYRLKQDVSTQEDEAYRRAIVAQPVPSTTTRFDVVVPVLDHFGSKSHNQLLVAGLPHDLQLSFRIPKYAELVRHQRDHTWASDRDNDAVATPEAVQLPPEPKIRVYLREHYTSLEKPERAMLVELTHQKGGLSWMVLDNEQVENHRVQNPFSDADAAETEKEERISLTPIKNPCSCLFAVCRLLIDLEPATIGEASNTGTLQTALAEAVNNPRPNYFGNIPISRWALYEQNKLFTPVYTFQYWDDILSAKFFNMDRNQRIAVIPFNRSPLVAEHGMGHKTMSNLNQPEFAVSSLKYFNVEGATKGVLDFSPITAEESEFQYDWVLNNWGKVPSGAAPGPPGIILEEDISNNNSTHNQNQIIGNLPFNDIMKRRFDVYGLVRNIMHQERGELIKYYN